MGRILKVFAGMAAQWGPGASGWTGRRPGVGLAEFKRVVRVAVNFLLQSS